MLGAMGCYAGGSWLHPHATAHSFFENFWCDLLRDPAHNGSPNGCSVALATFGFSALALALLPFWLEVARLLPNRRARFVRWAGAVSSLATGLVALLPSDRFPELHPPCVLTAGGLGFVCGGVCSSWALAHFRQVPGFALTSLLLLAAASLNLALYAHAVYVEAAETLLLPVMQKLATFVLLLWMVLGLRDARRLSAGRPTP